MRRSQLDELIRELEVAQSLYQLGKTHLPSASHSLEFAANLCNLTNCRNA